jgi:hypothetical protein
MSESDYLEMKKRKRTVLLRDRTSGNRTENIQYLNIQMIPKVNEDNEYIHIDRFYIRFPEKQDMAIINNNYSKKEQMYSIPRIHVAEYIKKRYKAPFCWSCPSKLDVNLVMNEIQCTVCEEMYYLSQFDISNLPNIMLDISFCNE